MSDKAMRSEIRVCLRLRGFPMPPETLTSEIGLQPTDSWKKGDPCRFAKTIFKDNGWEVNSGLDTSLDLGTHVKTLLKKLAPLKKNLAKVCAQCRAELVCVIYSYGGDRPTIYFEKEIMKQIVELNVSMYIDLYILNGD
jgi:hypothetical protein